MTCIVDGCDKGGKITRGMCMMHYTRWYHHGDASIVLPIGRFGKGRRKHFMYGSYAAMINRCHNPNNSSYARYGALGVYVCERWREDFLNFLGDMGERPEGKTLDRYPDPAGPYAPDNCRWATPVEQRQNRTSAGDQKMRDALSISVKRRWDKYRAEKAKYSPEYLATAADALELPANIRVVK